MYITPLRLSEPNNSTSCKHLHYFYFDDLQACDAFAASRKVALDARDRPDAYQWYPCIPKPLHHNCLFSSLYCPLQCMPLMLDISSTFHRAGFWTLGCRSFVFKTVARLAFRRSFWTMCDWGANDQEPTARTFRDFLDKRILVQVPLGKL